MGIYVIIYSCKTDKEWFAFHL